MGSAGTLGRGRSRTLIITRMAALLVALMARMWLSRGGLGSIRGGLKFLSWYSYPFGFFTYKSHEAPLSISRRFGMGIITLFKTENIYCSGKVVRELKKNALFLGAEFACSLISSPSPLLSRGPPECDTMRREFTPGGVVFPTSGQLSASCIDGGGGGFDDGIPRE